MPAMEIKPSPHRWNQIKKLPLHPAIRTLEQYEDAVDLGTADALAYLRGIDPPDQFDVVDIQSAHHLMFKGAHPWAGRFRQPGQLAIIAGFPAADPQRIERELELALYQMREMMEIPASSDGPNPVLAALAFFHVRFERVHPFLDGNGRSGRAILAVQFEKVFGTLPMFTDQVGYREAIRSSNKRDLASLINYLGTSVGLPRITDGWRAPFQIIPRFLEGSEEPSFEEDLAWSQRVL